MSTRKSKETKFLVENSQIGELEETKYSLIMGQTSINNICYFSSLCPLILLLYLNSFCRENSACHINVCLNDLSSFFLKESTKRPGDKLSSQGNNDKVTEQNKVKQVKGKSDIISRNNDMPTPM